MSSIRGIAAIVVAAVHAFQVFVLPYFGLYGVAHLATSFLATYAVIAFFIVSGFMIHLSVTNHRDADGKFDTASYFSARLLRIYPPLLTAVGISLVVYLVMTGLEMHGSKTFRLGGELFVSRERVEFEWDRLPATLLLVYNVFPGATQPLSIDGPLWTLSFEWWFYMFVMFAAGVSSRRPVLFGYLPLACLLLVFHKQPSGVLFWALFFVWMSGFLLGHLYRKDALSSRWFFPVAALTVFFCIAGIVLAGGTRTIDYIVEPLQRLGNRAHVVMMFMAFLLTLALATVIRRGARVRFLVDTADFSYTLYLIHYPLLLFAFGLLHPLLHGFGWVVSTFAAMLVTLLILPVAARLAAVVENRDLIASKLAGCFARRVTR